MYVAPKGEAEMSINHFEAALWIASSLNWHDEQFSIRYSPAPGRFFLAKLNSTTRTPNAPSHTQTICHSWVTP